MELLPEEKSVLFALNSVTYPLSVDTLVRDLNLLEDTCGHIIKEFGDIGWATQNNDGGWTITTNGKAASLAISSTPFGKKQKEEPSDIQASAAYLAKLLGIQESRLNDLLKSVKMVAAAAELKTIDGQPATIKILIPAIQFTVELKI